MKRNYQTPTSNIRSCACLTVFAASKINGTEGGDNPGTGGNTGDDGVEWGDVKSRSEDNSFVWDNGLW